MEASELADKLEQGGIFRITPEEEALRTKCVRFAADMEVLVADSTVRFTNTLADEIVCICSSWNGTFEMRAVGPDIYTATRKAVEAAAEKQ